MFHFLQLVRVSNLLILFFTQLFIKIFIIDKSKLSLNIIQRPDFIFFTISTLLIASAGYIINDYYDVKIDLINKPHKTLIGRYITRRTAIIWHLSLTSMGIFLGFYNGLLLGFINCVCAFLLWLYSNILKRLPLLGNVCIAVLSGLSIYMIAILYRSEYLSIFKYSLFAFYISLIREVIKDIQDLKGDTTFGCKTLPILWGIRKTKRFLYFLVFVFITNMVVFFPWFNEGIIIYLFVMVIIPLLFLVQRIERSDTLKDYKTLSTYCKIIMLSGMGSIIFL